MSNPPSISFATVTPLARSEGFKDTFPVIVEKDTYEYFCKFDAKNDTLASKCRWDLANLLNMCARAIRKELSCAVSKEQCVATSLRTGQPAPEVETQVFVISDPANRERKAWEERNLTILMQISVLPNIPGRLVIIYGVEIMKEAEHARATAAAM